jgi:hypothetical protein
VARSLSGIAVPIPTGAWMFVYRECCVLSVEGFAMVWSLVQRIPTECGVSECDHETSLNEEALPH